MHKNATKCKQNIKQLVYNKHEASKIIDKFATYQSTLATCVQLEPLRIGNISCSIAISVVAFGIIYRFNGTVVIHWRASSRVQSYL
jgi:hypothetical protein